MKATSTLRDKASSSHLPVFVSHSHYHRAQFYLLVALLFVALPLVALPLAALPLVALPLAALPLVALLAALPLVALLIVALLFVSLPLVGPSLTVLVSMVFGVLVEAVDSWYTVAYIFQYSIQLSVARNWEER